MPSRSVLLAPWLAALAAVVPVPAAGQDVPPEKLEEFERHVARGAELYKTEKYHEALEQFRQARNIVDHPKLSYKIGRTLEQLDRCAKARSAYQRYLDYEDLAEDGRDNANERLEGLENCEPSGHLELRCQPESARVTIGRQTFDCPVSVDLEAGSYRAEIAADGHPSRQVDIDIEPDGTHRRSVDLTAAGSPAGWRTYAKWSGVGLGSALFIGGLVSDISAIARHDRIADAAARGESARLQELDREARSAKTRTVVLYTSGAILAAGGATLFLLDSSGNSTARLDLRVGAGYVGAELDF